jgi:predicted nuclease with TOPRIM domain
MDQLMKTISTEQLAAQSEMTESLARFNKQVAEMKALVAEQKKLQAELTKKVDNQQEAVKAVDSFRLQVNRKLQQLEGTVRDLTQPPQEGLGLE